MHVLLFFPVVDVNGRCNTRYLMSPLQEQIRRLELQRCLEPMPMRWLVIRPHAKLRCEEGVISLDRRILYCPLVCFRTCCGCMRSYVANMVVCVCVFAPLSGGLCRWIVYSLLSHVPS